MANPNVDAGNETRNTRILAFDINREEIVGEYVYRFQPTGPGRADDEFDVPSIPGMTVLDGKTIAIANDNDFGVGTFTVTTTINGEQCRLNDSGRESQIIVIRLDKDLK